MSKKCNACIGAEVKEAMRTLDDKDLNDALDKIEDCPEPRQIEVCIVKRRTNKSPYNLFISNCLRQQKIKSFNEAPEAMRECAKQWRDHKEKP